MLQPRQEIIIVGAAGDLAADPVLSIIRRSNLVRTLVLLKSADNCDLIRSLAPYTDKMSSRDNKATAYICQNISCLEPVTEAEILEQYLKTLSGEGKTT